MYSPYVIVGLGNPGPKYAKTRHNAGFWFLDLLAEQAGVRFRKHIRLKAETARADLAGHACILAKPTTFMNRSGEAVRALTDYYGTDSSQLVVAYDELDLPTGVSRLKLGGGHGGHNGLRDVFRHLEDRNFLRLRIGIGHPGYKEAVTAYVLSRASAEEERRIRASVSDAASVMPDVMEGRLPNAMKQLHTS